MVDPKTTKPAPAPAPKQELVPAASGGVAAKAVAKAKDSPSSRFARLIQTYSSNIEACLPKHLTAERMINVARIAYSQDGKLQECDPVTVIQSIIAASRFGLEIGTECYLIPRYNKRIRAMECTFMPSYHGLMSMAYRSGLVTAIRAEVVHENDLVWEYEDGLEPFLRHKKAMVNRGKPICAWAAVTLAGGGVVSRVLSLDEIEEARKRGGDRSFSPWETDWSSMAIKTAVRRVLKFAPKSSEMQNVLQHEDMVEMGSRGAADVVDLQLAAPEDGA